MYSKVNISSRRIYKEYNKDITLVLYSIAFFTEIVVNLLIFVIIVRCKKKKH